MEDRHFREINSLWTLVDPLTVQQAAALIAGEEPNAVDFSGGEANHFRDPESGYTDSSGITWIRTAYVALINAILAGNLKAKLIHDSRPVDEADTQDLIDRMESGEYFDVNYSHLAGDDEDHVEGYFIKKKPDWTKTMLDVQTLKEWLISKNMKTGFFFGNEVTVNDYLDMDHPRYSARLAAAIKVWEAMEDENLLSGKSPKIAMAEWLQSRYKELGLIHNEKISKNAIDNVVSVVNWQTGGGAPSTPS